MFFSLRDINDYRFIAQDGEFGKVHSFLIDSFNWAARYVVVEVGSRKVLLSVLALGRPDHEAHVLPVNLTSEKIMNSPAIDLDRPLTRDTERQLSDYYEWPYYWEPDEVPNTLPGDLTSIPLIDMELERVEKEEASLEEEMIPQTGTSTGDVIRREDNMHSTSAMFGCDIHTTHDNRIAGKLSDMVTRDEDWNILYLVADIGGLLTSKKVLIAPQWVQRIDEKASLIDVDLKGETIQNSPEFRTVFDLTDDYQARLNDHYNRK